jgi:hypothetical protein
LANPFLQGSFSFAIIAQATLAILLLPVIEKPGGDLVASADLGWGAHSTQEFLNDLAFEFGTE